MPPEKAAKVASKVAVGASLEIDSPREAVATRAQLATTKAADEARCAALAASLSAAAADANADEVAKRIPWTDGFMLVSEFFGRCAPRTHTVVRAVTLPHACGTASLTPP